MKPAIKTSTNFMDQQSPGYSALRKGRRSIPDQIYLLTWATLNREPRLATLPAARTVVCSLKHADADEWTRTLAFVVMPDHVHWCIELGDIYPLARVMNAVKSYTANRLRSLLDVQEPIWQTGFHDRAARSSENIEAICRYVIANPLRAGIAESLEEYPHWDSIWHGS